MAMHEDDAAFEAQIAVEKAKLRAVLVADHAKEPYDTPGRNLARVYAVMELIVEWGIATGREYEWSDFLRGALSEATIKAFEREGI